MTLREIKSRTEEITKKLRSLKTEYPDEMPDTAMAHWAELVTELSCLITRLYRQAQMYERQVCK
ncbi:hypothetical protein CSR02_00185 [Acetobacter pomorum]|uniref:Uncharacterized protein n=1 Tax=Acetobacter pomorum TaxID=65959 RepID=A0A2G4RIP4_9PROT|nr:hypothetical protein [Acetobacter pomorum]PHY95595.1 hypothetical protein CSR02_00185 [Acetobacter pomorum]GBR47613.1 hypothetical protein AA11825_0725 [Acetobacter pomorum DSM 11825]